MVVALHPALGEALAVGAGHHRRTDQRKPDLAAVGVATDGQSVGAPGRESLERERGFAAELALAGLDYRRVLGDYSEESGLEAGLTLLQFPLDAVFVAGDLMAAGVLRALHRSGRSVPTQVSVVGFDDSLIAPLLYPRLSTVRQPAYQMGAAAAQMALDLIAGLAVTPMTFSPQLVRRESTDPPPEP